MRSKQSSRLIHISYTLILGFLIGIFVLLATILVTRSSIAAVLVYIVVTNVYAFLAYGFDKLSAVHHKPRIPEKVLLWLVISGGSAGALLGIQAFRHKTQKAAFKAKLGLILILQIITLWLLFRYTVSGQIID